MSTPDLAKARDSAAVTVVVPTVGRPTLVGCLESLAQCQPNAAEVLVVCQGDAAAVRAIVTRFGPPGTEVLEDAGRGVASGTNLGVRAAAHETVLVTHDDCTVDASWVEVATRLASERPDFVFTGLVAPGGDLERVPSCKTDPEAHDFTGQLEVGALYPNNMVLPRRLFVAFGGFDEAFTPEHAAEDCDFCFRWLAGGGALRYEPALQVAHHDWRSIHELERLYVRYARGSGFVYGNLLASGERRIVPFLVNDVRAGLRGGVDVVRGRPRWRDWRRSIYLGLPGGFVTGLRHGLRLRLRQR